MIGVRHRKVSSLGRAVLSFTLVLLGCGTENGDDAGTGGTTSMPVTGGAAGKAGSNGVGGAGAAGAATGGIGGAGSGGIGGASGGLGGAGTAGAAAGTAGAGAAGASAGFGGMAGAAGAAGMSGSGGQAGQQNLPPLNLSETGLFTARMNGELVLAPGVREFEPRYWLWSDGADKRRYVYLPPGGKIDTTDADHWVFPVGTKFWKSFISNGQLVETRLIELLGEQPEDVRYSTYVWRAADATDADRMEYLDIWIDAASSTHDIPNGLMCERCHDSLEDRVLGFSALQLNHDRPGVTLKTLLDEDLLTAPISLDIGMPGPDQTTKDALGYLHANCGNCHNDRDGVPLENVPEPQLLLRVSVNDDTLEKTGTYRTAINQLGTAFVEIPYDYRIEGGNVEESLLWFRMNERGIEYQMPPIGSELEDMTGLELIRSWIASLPPPAP